MTDAPMDGVPPTILIADDEPAIRLLIRITLEAEGYVVVEACDGEEALRLAREDAPDMVVLDVMMPKRSGIDVALELQEAETTRLLPIVFLTALATVDDVSRGIEAGALHYLSKPFAPGALIDRVRHSLEVGANGSIDDVRRARIDALRRHTMPR